MSEDSSEGEKQEKQRINRYLPSGVRHKAWKGEDAGPRGKHDWVRRWKARRDKGIPTKCEYCGNEVENKTKMDCACLIREAGPNNPDAYTKDMRDYVWLCRICHSKMDKGKEGEKIRKGMIEKNKKKYLGEVWTGDKRKKN